MVCSIALPRAQPPQSYSKWETLLKYNESLCANIDYTNLHIVRCSHHFSRVLWYFRIRSFIVNNPDFIPHSCFGGKSALFRLTPLILDCGSVNRRTSVLEAKKQTLIPECAKPPWPGVSKCEQGEKSDPRITMNTRTAQSCIQGYCLPLRGMRTF